MIISLPLPILPWHHHQHREDPQLRMKFSSRFQCAASLTTRGHRFISTLAAATNEPQVVAHRLISKFVASSPKSVALNALSHLLSLDTSQPHLSSLALPLYSRISEAPWFNWNPKLVADLVALLDKQGQYSQSQALIFETISKLQFKERDLALFYCNLIESHAKNKSEHGFNDSYICLNEVIRKSCSVYVKSQGYKSMVSALCEMGEPHEAENVVEEMRVNGLKLSLFEFRCVLYGYGRLGLFEDMLRIVEQMESEGFQVDTVSSNMVLSSYGAHNALSDMLSWLQQLKSLGIPFSVRTYNSVLNSCPMMISMLQDLKSLPLSLKELTVTLNNDEALLVKELTQSPVLDGAIEWGALEAKLDLHGMHLGSAYLIMLQWMDEMRNRFKDGKFALPAEIILVCGSGKHSSVRGESPVKGMVREIMVRTRSPMRIDRKNIGCFIAKGKVVRDWLC
ncbi:PPR domain-containing protein [Cephalotus follicularis]|uniref:PPR domain-containing protein n=1 Tax=Cephalotus follicularis TaxID=3775 RepID=A0A1Q3D2G5_CEPFO|nr:PPR domain-containing protein [Cephalotus follicularis]